MKTVLKKPNITFLTNKEQLAQVGTYPLDYDYLNVPFKYLIGMSVPPVMIAQIATKIYEQWLSKIFKQ